MGLKMTNEQMDRGIEYCQYYMNKTRGEGELHDYYAGIKGVLEAMKESENSEYEKGFRDGQEFYEHKPDPILDVYEKYKGKVNNLRSWEYIEMRKELWGAVKKYMEDR